MFPQARLILEVLEQHPKVRINIHHLERMQKSPQLGELLHSTDTDIYWMNERDRLFVTAVQSSVLEAVATREQTG
jgi:hypothetical protein